MKKQVGVSPQGIHIVLDLYRCKSRILNNPQEIEKVLREAVKKAKANLIDLKVHKFSPYGVSGIAVISESHISIHTWPEVKYASIDIYTCGTKTLPDSACKFLIKKFKSQRPSIIKILRGYYEK